MRIQGLAGIVFVMWMGVGVTVWVPLIAAESDEGTTKSSQDSTKSSPDTTKSSAESDETTRLIKAELPNWKFWKRGDREKELELEPKSLLRWTNPGTGRVYGDLYLWTSDGRPEVAMTLFKGWEPAMGFHVEIHSLSLVPLDGERKSKLQWQPQTAGIRLRNVPEAPVPADTPARRLAQMRTLANEFSSVLTDYRRNNAGERQALRLLPQPLYRYKSSDPNLIDGAMFAFVLGTDPEVFVLLEARRVEGVMVWQHGLARMNDDSLMVMHNEQEVWKLDRAKSRDNLRDPYVLFGVPETR